MTWIQTPNGRNVVLLAAAMAAMFATGLVLGVSGDHLARPWRMAIAGASIIPSIWLIGRYWHALDEAAQEAQKWAWFWGGTIGLALGLVAITIPQLGLAALAPAGATPGQLMGLGGLMVSMSAVAGFLVAWAWWWMARR